ncbi:aldo/keto reductase [Luxibacter massiliensis]|uniref:aldo/keto reductase n=1 Tax=Luxibacter massiliensis TaxID=2219695 RepID=UPI000F070522|nr:aldo/keto reductase [Luxibacter massiliensis]
MKKMTLGSGSLEVPVIAAGCMRINTLDEDDIEVYINKCMELGMNFFEHADIYGNGKCESLFAEAFEKTEFRREDVILQSKCGIVPGVMYDFSKEHILKSVENSLKRLNTDYLDVLVLHRPDALVEPEEVAEVFDLLNASGKVRNFGVSNHKPMQIELLKKYVKQDIVTNQLQFSIPFSNMVANGMEVNMLTEGSVDHDGSVLDYCRLHDMTIQAWSPFQYGFFEGVFIGSSKYPELNQQLEELAERYDTTPTAIAAAWILRHPAHIQMIAGTTNLDRLEEIARGSEIRLTREEWYQIYLSAGHILP